MKNKRLLICIILAALALAGISACGVDKKCPAYSQLPANTGGFYASL